MKFPKKFNDMFKYLSPGGSIVAETFMVRGISVPSGLSLEPIGEIIDSLWRKRRHEISWSQEQRKVLQGVSRVAKRARVTYTLKDRSVWDRENKESIKCTGFMLELDLPYVRIRTVPGFAGSDRITPDHNFWGDPPATMRFWEGETADLLTWQAWDSISIPWNRDDGAILKLGNMEILVLGTNLGPEKIEILEHDGLPVPVPVPVPVPEAPLW